jgi:hypothetical protein
MKLYDIIQTEDANVAIEEDSHFTIGTSPYYAHQHALAIDIYQHLQLDNYCVISPIEGEIVKIKELIAPKPKFLNGTAKDYLTLVRNQENDRIIYKILHVKPIVKIGNKIKQGDLLGETIRNGYFAYWSSPHLHLEIRSEYDAIRATGGRSFNLLFNDINLSPENYTTDSIPIEILLTFPEFLLVRLPKEYYIDFQNFIGVKGRINNNLDCILDGGIPHYKRGIAISGRVNKFMTRSSVFLGNVRLGVLESISSQFGIFEFAPFRLCLNGIEVRGISLFLSKKLPILKIVPYKINQFKDIRGNQNQLKFNPEKSKETTNYHKNN